MGAIKGEQGKEGTNKRKGKKREQRIDRIEI